MWGKHLITGPSTVNQWHHWGPAAHRFNWLTSCSVQPAQDALMKTFPCFSSLCSIPFSENAFNKHMKVARANAPIICLAQNTSVLMKELNWNVKPLPLRGNFIILGVGIGHRQATQARLVDWKVPSAIWKVSVHFQGSQKEKNSLLAFQLGHSFWNQRGHKSSSRKYAVST